MEKFKELLSIVIVTYNRALYLEKTLNALMNSPFSDCDIAILDNCSTDSTEDIISKYCNKFDSLMSVRNKYNIGGNANILRAIEFGSKEYIWILADDDTYDFSYTYDVLDVLNDGKVDLVHMGAHADVEWEYGGALDRIQNITNQGYSYFRFASFIGCNLFKVKSFIPYLISGYNNIVNSYPHMPFLISLYEENRYIYIAKNRIARASIGNQSYDFKSLIKWWLNTSQFIKDKNSRKKFCFAQFLLAKWKTMLVLFPQAVKKHIGWSEYFRLYGQLNIVNMLAVFFLLPLYCAYRFLVMLKNKLPQLIGLMR